MQLAHKLQLEYGSERYDIEVHRAAVNGVVGERVFDFPRKSQVQLPDLKQLFAEIDANQKAIDKVKENYTGRRAVEETQYDASGKVTKIERREETFFYLDGEEIATLVSKDGKPWFIAGPHDTPSRCRQVLGTLEKSCGSGRFEYIVPVEL